MSKDAFGYGSDKEEVEVLRAENARLKKAFNTLSIGVRNACAILGVELFLGQDEKTRLHEPAMKIHDALRKLVDDVDRMLSGT